MVRPWRNRAATARGSGPRPSRRREREGGRRARQRDHAARARAREARAQAQGDRARGRHRPRGRRSRPRRVRGRLPPRGGGRGHRHRAAVVGRAADRLRRPRSWSRRCSCSSRRGLFKKATPPIPEQAIREAQLTREAIEPLSADPPRTPEVVAREHRARARSARGARCRASAPTSGRQPTRARCCASAWPLLAGARRGGGGRGRGVLRPAETPRRRRRGRAGPPRPPRHRPARRVEPRGLRAQLGAELLGERGDDRGRAGCVACSSESVPSVDW